MHLFKSLYTIVACAAMFFAVAFSTFAQTPPVVCAVNATWVGPDGADVATPPAAAANSSYKVKAVFPSSCSGNGQGEIKVLQGTTEIASSGKQAIATANQTLTQVVNTSVAGTYKWVVNFYPTSGATQTTESRASLTISASGGNVNNQGNGNGAPVDTGGSTGGVIGTISNPISYDSLGGLVVGIIRFLLTMLGGLAVLFIIIGAVRMVTSAGNEKAVGAGKQTVQWAVIGLITALMAFSIISLVQSVIGRK